MIHVPGAGFCDDQLPILSTIGRGPVGPQGEKGDKGDSGMPTFADPLEWDGDREYEQNTIVQHDGDSYISQVYVPVGIDISNVDYWIKTGDYNAHLREVDNRLDAVEGSVTNLETIVPSSDFDEEHTVKEYIDNEFEQSYARMISYHKEAMGNRNHQGGFNIIAEFDVAYDYGYVNGCTWISGNNYVVGCSVSNTDNVYLFKWNSVTQTLTSPTLVQGYHDNSITYVPDLNELYICEAFEDADWDHLIPTITVVDYDTLTVKRRITVPMQDGAEGVYGLAYDRTSETFYATLWRGNTEGKSNRIYKYDKTLTEYLGYVDLDDFTSRYKKTSSNQGVQYVSNGLLWEIYYDFGLVAGFDIETGERKVLFNTPYFANNYRFVGELEAVVVNEDTNSVICFTMYGAFECGIFKDVYEDKPLPTTIDPKKSASSSTNKINVVNVDVLDTHTFFERGTARRMQDAVTLGSLLGIHLRVYQGSAEAGAMKETLYVINFNGELAFGTVGTKGDANYAVKVIDSNVIIWGGKFKGSSTAPMDLSSEHGNLIIYNSRVKLHSVVFDSPSGIPDIDIAWNSILMLESAYITWKNGIKSNDGGLIVNLNGTLPTITGTGYKTIS